MSESEKTLSRTQVILSIVLTSILILSAIIGGLFQVKAYADETYLDEKETVTIVTWVLKTESTTQELIKVNEEIKLHQFKVRNLPNGEIEGSIEQFELEQAQKRLQRLETKRNSLSAAKPEILKGVVP